ncbi:MAG TPA: long-chain fatty acid--CoA ligase [Candidatus Obscuribacterales bacterium]
MNKSLASIFYFRASQLGDREAVRFKEGKSAYRGMSWAGFAAFVREIAFGLAARGLQPGERVAILSQTSHLWAAVDLATISNGAVSVPIYPTSSQKDIEFILSNSEAKVVFVQNESLLRKTLAATKVAHSVKTIVLLSGLTKGRSLSEFVEEEGVPDGLVIGLEELTAAGHDLAVTKPTLVTARTAEIGLDNLATIIYTSGTTGTPKGVPLTHKNVITVLEDLTTIIPINENDVYLSYLPMSHVLERVAGEFYWMHSGGVCAFAEGIETMAKNMAEVKPSMIIVVPRVLDKIYAKVRSGIEGASGRARDLIDWAINVGVEIVRHKAQGKEPRIGLKAKHWVAERIVFKKLRERIGPNLRLIVSGGAPATPQVIEFFNAIGIATLEGYGLTETAAPAAVNRVERIKPGTVGPALPSVEMKVAEDGEILLKGPSIFSGYFNAETATEEAFVDGWFKTGDIGIVDGDGYLKITDRKKDIIVNSSGKNIAPQKVEAELKTVPFVNQAVVFGDRQKQLVALLVLDEQAVVDYATEQGWSFKSYQDLTRLPELHQFLREEIDLCLKPLADYEKVGQFYIMPQDLSVEAGELTATLKIKRGVVAKRYKTVIDSLYKGEETARLVGAKR